MILKSYMVFRKHDNNGCGGEDFMKDTKVKVKRKKSQIIIRIRVPADYVININQSDILQKKYKSYFFKLETVKKRNLTFQGSNLISLSDRFRKVVSEYEFFFIIEQFVDIIEKLERIGLSRDNFILDLKYVFIDETTQELYFVYLPIASSHQSVDCLLFLSQLVHSVKLDNSDNKYISGFSYFLRNAGSFEADKIESFIRNFDSDIIHVIKSGGLYNNKSNGQKSRVKIVDEDCTDIMLDDDKTDLMEDENQPNFFSSNDVLNAGNPGDHAYDEDKTYIMEENQTNIASENDKTDLIGDIQSFQNLSPVLIRMLTEEVIKINKPVFRIGKEEGCVDYIVTNNATISRSHADIISRGGKYFVFDLRSKNKSYINNRVVPAEHEVEIFNGDVLKLSNEEFLFRV